VGALVAILSAASEPVRVEHGAAALWQQLSLEWATVEGFLGQYGSLRVGVASGTSIALMGPSRALNGTWVAAADGPSSIRLRHPPSVHSPSPSQIRQQQGDRWLRRMRMRAPRLHGTSLTLPLRDFMEAVHNGSLPTDAYCFHDLDRDSALRQLAARLHGLDAFFRSLTMSKHQRYERLHPARLSIPRAGSGRLRLAIGAEGSGNAWHQHGDALNAAFAGRKRWWFLINSTEEPLPLKRSRDSRGVSGGVHTPLRGRARSMYGLPTIAWLARAKQDDTLPAAMCTQRAGDLIFVPGGTPHSVLNGPGDALAVAIQHDAEGATLLHHAARAGDTRTVIGLLAAGAAVDARDADGRTALYESADAGDTEAVRQLLSAGADPRIKDRTGQGPAYRAAAGGHEAILSLITGVTDRSGGERASSVVRGRHAMRHKAQRRENGDNQ
jgi:hypothetical protein